MTTFASATHRTAKEGQRWDRVVEGLSKLPFPPIRRIEGLWLAFVASALLSSVGRTFGADESGILYFFALVGSVTCGWSWLLSRSLFVPGADADDRLPVAIVCGVLGLQFIRAGGISAAGDIVQMVGSTFVVLALGEALRRSLRAKSRAERLFAVSYSAFYVALVGVGLLWAGSLPREAMESVQSICALVSALGAGVAVLYRRRHPMSEAPTLARKDVTPAPADNQLASRIVETIEREELFLVPNIKVADMAARLGQPEYRLTRCVTGILGYSNFNRLVNERRIERAKLLLADKAQKDKSILCIGLDCGFASIGPFNRAFREATGVTPSAYRRANTT